MAQRKSKPHRRPSLRTPEPPHSQGGFRLPPGVSYHKEPLADGMAFVFRHEALGLLGRIVLQDIAGGKSHISLELAGDPRGLDLESKLDTG